MNSGGLTLYEVAEPTVCHLPKIYRTHSRLRSLSLEAYIGSFLKVSIFCGLIYLRDIADQIHQNFSFFYQITKLQPLKDLRFSLQLPPAGNEKKQQLVA